MPDVIAVRCEGGYLEFELVMVGLYDPLLDRVHPPVEVLAVLPVAVPLEAGGGCRLRLVRHTPLSLLVARLHTPTHGIQSATHHRQTHAAQPAHSAPTHANTPHSQQHTTDSQQHTTDTRRSACS